MCEAAKVNILLRDFPPDSGAEHVESRHFEADGKAWRQG